MAATVQHIVSHILTHFNDTRQRPLFVAFQGPQGSGKSYLSNLVKAQLSSPPHSLNTIVISLDDLYLPRSQLIQLAQSHPDNILLQGRGLPGTHDVHLGAQLFSALKATSTTIQKHGSPAAQSIELPRFDKSLFDGQGDRCSTGTRLSVTPVDIVILEGWCVGFHPISSSRIDQVWDTVWKNDKQALNIPDSSSPSKEDILAINSHLERYVELWSFFSVFVQLVSSAPTPPQNDSDVSYGCGISAHDNLESHPNGHSQSPSRYSIVYRWRLEQERNMKSRNGGQGMSDDHLKSFVDRYIPGYVFFQDTTTNHSTGSLKVTKAGMGPESSLPPCSPQSLPWLGRSIRITLSADRLVEEVSFF